MGAEDHNEGLSSENYRDVLISVRVFGDEIPDDVVKQIVGSDIHEVVYRVGDRSYLFQVQDVNFMDSLN